MLSPQADGYAAYPSESAYVHGSPLMALDTLWRGSRHVSGASFKVPGLHLKCPISYTTRFQKAASPGDFRPPEAFTDRN